MLALEGIDVEEKPLKTSGLGELELAIMNCIWKKRGPVTVPEVHEHLLKKRDLAYTSTMTVMSRLHEKGLLHRNEEQRPYSYWPSLGRDDYYAELMVGVLSDLGNRKAALARFVDRISPKDAETLKDLMSEARRRRR